MPIRPYAVRVPLRWSDMDALRHVNNVQVARLLEEARVLGLREWFAEEQAHHPRLLVARCEIDYLRQLHYRPEPVVIRMWTSRIAGASFDLSYEIVEEDTDDAPAIVRAETTQVAFDMDAQRPVRIPTEAREILQRYAGAPVEMKRRGARG
ncbi:acyl-CoA thioesterase [Calidifontibacter sp. DB0510]|uniref:Acyl-CoA thioesterase n=1 Tax=Metallococcus carri TaxID=1656884 RepID=A0A967EA39_9MICO|nr:thioesterase family protein [Metallococcus carri]NHN55875.1 acyl-CoA thioesterase [Metallococcus carri]NOP38437.1 acyl-CoA thioesterase [Calidifontibacter sp. DB2511S]